MPGRTRTLPPPLRLASGLRVGTPTVRCLKHMRMVALKRPSFAWLRHAPWVRVFMVHSCAPIAGWPSMDEFTDGIGIIAVCHYCASMVAALSLLPFWLKGSGNCACFASTIFPRPPPSLPLGSAGSCCTLFRLPPLLTLLPPRFRSSQGLSNA